MFIFFKFSAFFAPLPPLASAARCGPRRYATVTHSLCCCADISRRCWSSTSRTTSCWCASLVISEATFTTTCSRDLFSTNSRHLTTPRRLSPPLRLMDMINTFTTRRWPRSNQPPS